jgi:hypothetical protein
MSKGKTRLGLIGLCVTVVMAMMAFAASGAQASAWMINGNNVTAENLTVTVNLTQDTLLRLLATSGGVLIAIDCLGLETTNAVLHNDGTAAATLVFTECHTFLNGTESPVCRPVEPIEGGGKLAIATHEGATYLKAENPTGAFMVLEFGEECSLPEEVKVTGTGWLVDCEGWEHGEEEALTHLAEEAKAPAEALGGLKFGKNAMTIDGSVIFEVIHNEEMVEWSALG